MESSWRSIRALFASVLRSAVGDWFSYWWIDLLRIRLGGADYERLFNSMFACGHGALPGFREPLQDVVLPT